MKKLFHILIVLLTTFAITACSSDDDINSSIVLGNFESATEVIVLDLTSSSYGTWELANYYKDLAQTSGKAIQGFDKLPSNDFASVTINNIDDEISEGHLQKVAAAYPFLNWKDCKMIIVCGRFIGHGHNIQSTEVIKSKSDHYYIFLDAYLEDSYAQALGNLFCTAYVFPNKKAKVDYNVTVHGYSIENNE